MIEGRWRLFTLRKAQEDMLFGYLLVPFSCCFYLVENGWLNAGSHNAPKEAV